MFGVDFLFVTFFFLFISTSYYFFGFVLLSNYRWWSYSGGKLQNFRFATLVFLLFSAVELMSLFYRVYVLSGPFPAFEIACFLTFQVIVVSRFVSLRHKAYLDICASSYAVEQSFLKKYEGSNVHVSARSFVDRDVMHIEVVAYCAEDQAVVEKSSFIWTFGAMKKWSSQEAGVCRAQITLP